MTRAGMRWWEQPWLLATLIVLCTVPLLFSAIPPFVDLPGHMGRYQLELDDLRGLKSPYFHFTWTLIGNLGGDLLIIPLGLVFGVETGTRLLAALCVVLTGWGFVALARAQHGRVPPTALLALPFVYAHPFIFGFINFCLSMALAFLATALWITLGKRQKLARRAVLFLGIAPVIWLCHIYGWACLCLMCGAVELDRVLGPKLRLRALPQAAMACLPLTPPIILLLLWRSGGSGGETSQFFRWDGKIAWLRKALRDHWVGLDLASVLLVLVVICLGILGRGLRFNRAGVLMLLAIMAAWIALPYMLFGSALADTRLGPYLLILGLLALDTRGEASANVAPRFAAIGGAFLAVRLIAHCVSFALIGAAQDRALGAIAYLPPQARVVNFVGDLCRGDWGTHRLEHIAAVAIIRRHAFSNEQWALSGAQLLHSDYPASGPGKGRYADPSHLVQGPQCHTEGWQTLDSALAHLPRDQFDYVWLIEPPAYDPRSLSGITKLWANGPDALYRIEHNH